MNIYEKIAKITTELTTVAKNLNVATGTGSYKAVSERDVKDAVKPLEDKYGVLSYPVNKEIIESDLLEDAKGRRYRYMRLKVTMRFVNVEEPKEFIEVVGFGDGLDTGDKAPGKADTYAQKYCLLSCYKISTGDDPDAKASDEQGYTVVESLATPNQKFTIQKYYGNQYDVEKLTRKQASDLIARIKNG